MTLLTQLKHILTKVNQVSPSMTVAVLKKELELAMQENEDGLQVEDDIFTESFLETIERIWSTTGDQDPYSERRFIKAIEQTRREEDDESANKGALVETAGLGSGERERFRDDEDSRSEDRFFEEEACGGYDAVSTETGLESSEQSQRQQRFDDDEDCFSEQSSSFLETNRREEEERQGGFADNDAFLELLLENIERSKRERSRQEQKRSSSDDDKLYPSSSSSSLSEDEIAALFHKRHSQTQKPQMLPKSDAYKCSVCGKEFSSFQALGGHKASHRIKPLHVNFGEKTRQKMLAPSGKIHKCSICHKVFPTGQSLGGHKRLHYEGALGGHKGGLDVEAVSQGDKLIPSGSGDVVTHVSDPKQSLQGLIDMNNVLSPGDVESANKLQQGGITNTNRIQFFNFL